MNRFTRGFGLLLLLATLTACGFQLRGTDTLGQLDQVYAIQASNKQQGFARILYRNLEEHSVQLIKDPWQADLIIDLLEVKERSRLLSVGSDSLASEYERSITVTFRLFNRDRKIQLEPRKITRNRSYLHSSGQVLSKSREQDEIRQTLYREISESIWQQLLAHSRSIN